MARNVTDITKKLPLARPKKIEAAKTGTVLEQRTDLLLSTLRNCVKGMGGDLDLIVEFPDGPPVEIVRFAAMENERRENPEDEARV